MKELLERYKSQSNQLIKVLLGLSVAAGQSYDQICSLTPNERELLSDVLIEKAEAQNPNKKSQIMNPGKVNGPEPNQQPRSEPR